MKEIDMIAKEFDESMKSFKEARAKADFHEAGDIKSYMYGLIKAAQIVYRSRLSINDTDFKTIDIRLSKLNLIDNPRAARINKNLKLSSRAVKKYYWHKGEKR